MSTITEENPYPRPMSAVSVALMIEQTAPSVSKRIHREVRFGAYVLGSTLGEGEFGKVKLGWRKDGKQPSQVAIKLIKRDTLKKDAESEIKVHREINSLRMLSHPNIVNLVEVMKSGKYIGIVLEYASGGELFDYILQHKCLKESIAKKLFAQLVSGVDYMHSKGLVHRDLKLENLLLDKHKNVVISDFGFVNSYNIERSDLMKTSCGSPCYAAPELVLTQSPYEGRKVDIWSLGVILYAMLAGYLPFDDDAENEDGADIVRLYHYICKTPLTFPEYVTPLARDLLRKIIVPDPRKRISMAEIRKHPWLAPYANLLSIRQSEWDSLRTEANERSVVEQIIDTNSNKNKRYSMFPETTNSSALMLSSSKPAKGRTYASNADIIYSNPTTSSSLANVVALPNSSEKAQGISASSMTPGANVDTRGRSESYASDDNGSPTKARFQKGHSKAASLSGSYPTASLALQAMVKEREAKRTSNILLDSEDTTRVFEYPVSPPHPQRSTTYSGTIGTISETPNGAHSSNRVGSKSPAESTISDAKEMPKFPHAKKPRPTSYHPGSMTSSMMAGNNVPGVLFDYVKMPGVGSTMPQFFSSSPTKAQADPIDPQGSPLLSTSIRPRSSRRDSVVTPINVNGVLTKDLNSHENKRNSVLSYLEDKMDQLELNDLPTRQSQHDHSPTKITATEIPKLENGLTMANTTPKIDQIPAFAPTSSPVMKSNEKSRPSPEDTEIQIDENYVTESIIKPGSETSDNVENQARSKKDSVEVSRSTTASGTRNTNPTKTDGKDAVTETKDKKESRSSRKDTKEQKENKDSGKENKKRNRFSLISLYSTFNDSSLSNIDNGQAERSSSGRKVLEPSNESNIISSGGQGKRHVSGSSGSSNTGKSAPASGAQNSYVNGKEASAARKVMNFFKRRSLRVG